MQAPFNVSGCFTRLLRICNSLKRRLSRSQDTALCGRILIFLASIFPLCDRSGVNLKSTFNSGNVTVFEDGRAAAKAEAAKAAQRAETAKANAAEAAGGEEQEAAEEVADDK